MNNLSEKYTRADFLACKWSYNVSHENHYGYSSVRQSLERCAKEKFDSGQAEQAKILELLSRSASMMMAPDSLNEPFDPYFQDYRAGRRSALPDDFTSEELAFFEDILDDINEPWLKARLSDLLWLCKKPKDPTHAKKAIESYISHDIDPDTWHCDVNNCWERAAMLCIQIRDFDKLDEIKNQIYSAFHSEFRSRKFMTLWLAYIMDKLNIDSDFKEDIAATLFKFGNELIEGGDYNAGRSYFELAAKKFQQSEDEKGWLKSLVSIGDCFEREADSRAIDSYMAANSFYENAIQAYRRIPKKNREDYKVSYKIHEVRKKITASGKASLDEMDLVETPGVDLSDTIDASRSHVSGKRSVDEALMFFTGLYSGPEYSKLADSAKKNMQHSIIGSLMGSSQMSSDGRVVAKTPPMNLNAGEADPANQAVLNRQIQQQFAIEIQLVVEGQVMPALRQLLLEHRVTKGLVEALCYHSPIVPHDRKYLLGFALWLGFEHDFRNAIHLLSPQVENIVCIQLKEAGAHTSNIDQEGVENENGLSTLLTLPEATQIFGEDLVFELKSVFTDSLGFNLRNEVAHGLLNDTSSSSISTIYAWWMTLRIVVTSLLSGSIKQKDTESEREPPCRQGA